MSVIAFLPETVSLRRFRFQKDLQRTSDRITQGPLTEETVYAKIYNENAADQDRGSRFVQACAFEMHMDMPQKPFNAKLLGRTVFYARIYWENAAPQDQDNRFLPARTVKSTWTCHTSSFYAETYREKNRNPDGAPCASTGVHPYHKSPSVWTHCVGNR